MSIALSQLEIVINIVAIGGILYRMGVKEGEIDKKIDKACDRLERQISELKIRVVKKEMDFKDLEKSVCNKEQVLRKEYEWGQNKDDRRIKRLYDIVKDIETKLKEHKIYLDTDRATHY